MGTFKTIVVEKEDSVACITLNRPEVMNAIDQLMIDELLRACQELSESQETRVVILTGAGKAFQAGADIAELAQMSPLDILRWNAGIVKIGAILESMPQPVIAAINGAAMGGGLEIALACTLRVASSQAKLALPEVKLGIIPGAGGTQRLPRLIGKSRAAKIILTAETLSAEQALAIGLVDEIAVDDNSLKAAKDLAARIIRNAPVACQMAKDAMEVGLSLPLNEAIEYAQKNLAVCFSTEDMREGTAAFLEKRAPRFRAC
jgi:enoyl-CoA hydratase/carnithine racemase